MTTGEVDETNRSSTQANEEDAQASNTVVEPEAGKVLAGQEAYDLYKQGREAWNQWADTHAGWVVDFTDWDFSEEKEVNFSEFRFPGSAKFNKATFGNRYVSFDHASFGEGRVYFERASFGEGHVNFGGASFGEGPVSFQGASFGDGHVNFAETSFDGGDVAFNGARFGDGDLIFNNARFGDGGVTFWRTSFGKGVVSFQYASFGDGFLSFADTSFGEGHVSFMDVSFGKGGVLFQKANFGDGNVDFLCANFGDGGVSFYGARFGDGDVNFDRASFGDGVVYFIETNFGDGRVTFNKASFGDGVVSFEEANFGDGDVDFFGARFGDGDVHFDQVIFGDGDVSFRGASFPGAIVLDKARFHRVPDFRQVNFGREISLHNTEVGYQEEWYGIFLKKAVNEEASDRLRGLRRMAAEARDHTREMDFFAKENRAKYIHELNLFQYFPIFLYDFFSDFGRSILRPVVGLLFTIFGSAWVFYDQSWKGSFWDALWLSVSNALPFVPWSRAARPDYVTALYGQKISELQLVNFVAYGQSILSLIFIFLIGLALRNKLRL
ncbi:hypothetical protein [Microbulbifer discodermiae]|uniref:hypothetical protein n=1 Tax=Microbulbifer sp. 2201CG32-9 TaxID=3232309 RepID=UPI00345C0C6A